MSEYYLLSRKSSDNLREFYATLTLLNRQEELHQLVKWAKRKGHLTPLRLYESRLADTQKALFRAEIELSHVAACTRTAHTVKKILYPRPKYYQKGSASAYKRPWLTA